MDRQVRAKRIFDLRNAGWTYPEIQAKLGISHQTLWKIIKSPEYAALVEDLEAKAVDAHVELSHLGSWFSFRPDPGGRPEMAAT